MPRSGRDNGGELAPFCAGLFERGVDSGVKVGGVPLRRRAMLAFGRNARLAYDARLSCSAYVTKRDNDLAFSPLKLMTSSALKAPRNSLNVDGVKFSPLRASVRRLTTPATRQLELTRHSAILTYPVKALSVVVVMFAALGKVHKLQVIQLLRFQRSGSTPDL
jgi:hypothetical protein